MLGQVYDLSLLFNELSLHGQFLSLPDFRDAVDRLMAMRAVARQYGREVECRRNVAYRQVAHELTLLQASHALGSEKRKALMQWLNRQGPFWEDLRHHSGDEWLECNGDIVTDSAVGESAYCLNHGIVRSLVSISPSSWLFSPLVVTWEQVGSTRSVAVTNYWEKAKLSKALAATPVPVQSWTDLEVTARSRCSSLRFLPDSFKSLLGFPFNKAAAGSLLLRLNILQEFKNCFDENGERTSKGHDLYRDHFMGDRAWFSDSSASEKTNFEKELTFPHPDRKGDFLVCTWHGKVEARRLPLRIHFSWPVKANESLFIAYVGQKITKR